MQKRAWLAILLFGAGCGEVLKQQPDADNTPRLTVEKTGTGGGTVTSTPGGIDCGAQCSAPFAADSMVTLHAAADTGAAFVGWSGGACSGTGDCVVTLAASTTVTAEFAAGARTLTVTPTGSGTISSSPAGIDCGSTCSASFADGTEVTLTASPLQGTTFMGWGGACSGTGTTCTVTLTGDVSVSGSFVCAAGSRTFSYTGAMQVVNQPACVTSINVDVRGAAGGAAYYLAALGGGAFGGRVQGTLAISQGAVLNVFVGGAGAASDNAAGGVGGFNGGGRGEIGISNQTGGGGGGASDIRLGGSGLGNRVFVAGGGGGAAACGGALYDGGVGGGTTGGTAPTLCTTTATAATGGTQGGGGAGGTFPNYCSATAGSLGTGAPACNPSGGGGAGGGYYGGGGGSWGGGGGGSSYATGAATNVTHTQGYQPGNGSVIVSW